MTLLERCLKIVSQLNSFSCEMIKDSQDNNEYPHINGKVSSSYRTNTNRRAKEYEDLLERLANSDKLFAKEAFTNIYNHLSTLNWDKKYSEFPFKEIKGSDGNTTEIIGWENAEFSECLSLYKGIERHLWSMFDETVKRFSIGEKGLVITTTESKLNKCFDILVENKYVDERDRAIFIKSLSGKFHVGYVKWRDGASINHFCKSLNGNNILCDFINNNKISWERVVEVFPFDRNGKKLTPSISGNAKHKMYYETKVDDAVKNLV